MKVSKSAMHGFTLIELLIVVAIIAILAAIAVPNFLEAQTRAKIGRVKSDQRTIALALETYRIDHNSYPDVRGYKMAGITQWNRGGISSTYPLTTPVAYMTTVQYADPFCNALSGVDIFGNIPYYEKDTSFSIQYYNVQQYWKDEQKKPMYPGHRPKWYLNSLGPDFKKDYGRTPGTSVFRDLDFDGSCHWVVYQYDATNGTISKGDILRYP